jgi:hypothetical protein
LPSVSADGASMVVVMRLPGNSMTGQAFWTSYHQFVQGIHWPFNDWMVERWGFEGQVGNPLTGKYTYGSIMVYAVVADPAAGQTKMYVNGPSHPPRTGRLQRRVHRTRRALRGLAGAPPIVRWSSPGGLGTCTSSSEARLSGWRRASPQMYAVVLSPSELAQLFQALKTKHNA